MTRDLRASLQAISHNRAQIRQVLLTVVPIIMLTLSLALLGTLLAGCGQTSSADRSLSDVKSRGVIVVATDDTYPPLEYNENGKIVGYDIDLMTEVASRFGVKAQFVSSKWDGLLSGLSARQYDAVISSMNITPERQKQANFVEYQRWAQVIVMSPKATPISTLQGLEGKLIAVQVATTSEEMAKTIKDARISSFESFDTTFMELKAGRCDAIIIDEPVAMYYQKKDPGSFKITGLADQKAPVGIALRKDAVALRDAIAKALDDMVKDGTADRIFEKWFK